MNLSRERAVEVMRIIRKNIDEDPTVNVSQAAREAGLARSTFYRWLATPPQKIDVVQLATLADFLHDSYGHPDFAAIWRDVVSRIK